MAFHFPFFNREKNQKRRTREALEQGKLRSERISSAPNALPQQLPNTKDPRTIVKQFQNGTRHGIERNQDLHVPYESNRNVRRREEFFDSLTHLNPLDRIVDAVDKRQSTEEEIQRSIQKRILSRVKVIAFVGGPGTGKSTKAIQVASLRNIEFFIDDGLLIEGGTIIAGSSAKKASTKIESVRQAIFYDDSRAANMRRTLLERNPDKLMILGTSDGMILKICERLWLNKPLETIRIEDVSSPEERRIAKTTRQTQGSHTIPVPSMEIKHEFSGYFQDPLKFVSRRRRDKVNTQIQGETERTVVRPTFSSLGKYLITDEALASLLRILLEDVQGLCEVLRVEVQKEVYGAVLFIELSLYYGYNAQEVMQEVQDIISEQVENYTAINILSVNVSCRKVIDARKHHNAS